MTNLTAYDPTPILSAIDDAITGMRPVSLPRTEQPLGLTDKNIIAHEPLKPASALPSHRDIIVHFGGSCIGNPGPGGWAAHVENAETGRRCTRSGSHLGKTTNGRMEIAAALGALRFIKEGATVTMVGDARYVIDSATEWLPNWKARGWKKVGGIANVDLWKEIDVAMQRHAKVTWAWQKGHVGHPLNELVDQLAKREALRRQKYPLQDDRVAHGELPNREREAISS